MSVLFTINNSLLNRGTLRKMRKKGDGDVKTYRNKRIKDMVYSYLAQHPLTTNKGLSKQFPDVPDVTLRVYKSTFKGSKYESSQIIEQFKWFYIFTTDKLIKGIIPSEVDRKRLRIIEDIINIKEAE